MIREEDQVMNDKPKLYITIIDPTGGINIADNTIVAVSHRVLFEKSAFHGTESLAKFFKTPQDMINFLMLAASEQSGKFGKLTWEHK